MLITENIVYIGLQKTGCSHTRKILESLFLNHSSIDGHTTYDALPQDVRENFPNMIKMGNIRNPWDWYVSLWAFGCMRKGTIYFKTTKDVKRGSLKWIKNLFNQNRSETKYSMDTSIWKELYSDPNNVENFRKWLKLVLGDFKGAIGEDYKESIVSNVAGLFTYRYLNLFTYEGKNLVKSMNDYSTIVQHDKENNFMDLIIRNEKIHEDLLENAEKMGLEFETVKKVLGKFKTKTNASERMDYHNYYDHETIQLVQSKDRLIIDKYGYTY